ncbi:hypothetical protein ACCO45_012318 [Purpureocillium lilacinum]|uniref:Uncharacterized protein n=1 Tax=Purpureocillium lilacinum TaxID=33203 RepID=A0ACC4D7S8_PURLI
MLILAYRAHSQCQTSQLRQHLALRTCLDRILVSAPCEPGPSGPDKTLIAASEINISEKPFECPECARCFSRCDLLRRHQQKLHRTKTPFRTHNRRESATNAAPVQCRARNDSAAAVTAGTNSAAACMPPTVNSITHVAATATKMIASGNDSAAQCTAAQACHPSVADFSFHMDQGGTELCLPELDIPWTLPPLPAFDPDFDFEDIFVTPAWTINSTPLQYNDSPQSVAMEQRAPLDICMNDAARGSSSIRPRLGSPTEMAYHDPRGRSLSTSRTISQSLY